MSLFVKEDMNTLNISFIYTDHAKIVKKASLIHTLNNPGTLSKEELLYIIKNNLIVDDIKYRLDSISLFHFDIDESELQDSNYDKELIHYKSINDINFTQIINIFSDLSTLYLLFKLPAKTNNTTKRVYINSITHHNKNTRKKQYKDK